MMTLLGMIFFKLARLKFNIRNSFNYVAFPALKGATRPGITTPLGSANLLSSFGRLAGYTVGPLGLTEHAIDPLTYDTLLVYTS